MLIIENPELLEIMAMRKGQDFDKISPDHPYSVVVYTNKGKVHKIFWCDKDELVDAEKEISKNGNRAHPRLEIGESTIVTESFQGEKMKFKRSKKLCECCGGSGNDSNLPKGNCEECDGKGYVIEEERVK